MKKILIFLFVIVITYQQVKAQGGYVAFAIPGRPDSFTQGQVDQLLANGNMNFDGIRFDNKRMEFINFDKGSFRGTTFYNTILNDGVARRKNAEPDRFDFEDANFYVNKLKRVRLNYWKFLRTLFNGDSITDGTFKYCSFTDSKFYNAYIINNRFTGSAATVFNNIEFYSCTLKDNFFDSIKFNGGALLGEVKFITNYFNNVEFFNTNFIRSGTLNPVKFTAACSFKNVKIKSCSLDGVVLGEAPAGMWIENTTFENANWRNGKATASFNENCSFTGAVGNLQNIDFTTSTFNSFIFGQQPANYKLPIKMCRFNNCTFNGPVIFYNCNLEGTIFPAVSVLQAANVKFINCLNAPYVSPG